MITPTERIAGWLDVAAAPIWNGASAKICIHPVCLHNCTCHAISLDGRWVCAGDGRLTIFKSHESAEHFLALAHIDHYERGESAELANDCGVSTQCVTFRPKSGLRPCRDNCAERH